MGDLEYGNELAGSSGVLPGSVPLPSREPGRLDRDLISSQLMSRRIIQSGTVAPAETNHNSIYWALNRHKRSRRPSHAAIRRLWEAHKHAEDVHQSVMWLS